MLKKIRHHKKKIIKFSKAITKLSLYWLGFFLLSLGFWIEDKFGSPGFEQILFHVQFGADGLMKTDVKLVSSFMKRCLFIPLVLACLIYLYEILVLTIRDNGADQTFSLIKQRILKWFHRFYRVYLNLSVFLFRKKLPVLLIIVASVVLLTKVSFWEYLRNRHESTFLAENYLKPENVTVPQKKKNLILIYVESLEATFSNKAIFGRDLLLPLKEQTKDAYQFGNFRQTFGTGWTMAGIISSQCAIPLRPILYNGNDNVGAVRDNLIGSVVTQFLPNVTCLGDILHSAGYKNIFLGGASLSFSGKGTFLQSHGYDMAYGLEEWEAQGEQHLNHWGLYDDDLFRHAKEHIDEMEVSGKPYNLTILTVDTHMPEGHLSSVCEDKGVRDYPGIVECTAGQLASLVQYVTDKGYLDNTNVVIMGDHLAMDGNIVYKKLAKDQAGRTIFNRFITQDNLEQNREQIYHFDILPSILYSLGFRFPHNRLGLGASGFGEIDPGYTLYHELDLDSKLSMYSTKYLEFWKKPSQHKG